MKISKKFNTILFKLSASFVVIIAFSVLLTGVFASISFRIYSNSQIMSANEIILNDTCEFIDKDILTKADELYLRFVLQGSENNLFSKMVQQDEIKDYREMNNMKKLLADQQVINSEWMSDMAIYFGPSDVVISSGGILYQRGEPQSRRPKWIDSMIEGENGFFYYPTNDYASDFYEGKSRVCRIIRSYNTKLSSGAETSYIMFGIKESAISKILKKTNGKSNDNVILVVDTYGNVISASEDFEKYSKLQSEGYWSDFNMEVAQNESDGDIGTFTRKIDGVKYVFSYRDIDKYNWKIVNIVPEKVLFKGTRNILLITVLICILAMALAFVISGLFTRIIYNPFKSILNSAMRTLGKPSGGDSDEYGIINDAISQMEDYNNTIFQNRNLIKYNMVNGIINNRFRDETQLDSVLKLCEKDFKGNTYTAVLFTANRSFLDELTVENRRFVMFKLIEVLESLSNDNATYFAAEKDEYSVIAVAAYNHDGKGCAMKDAHYVNDYMFSNYYIPFFAVVGDFLPCATNLYESGKKINESLEYRMFMKGMNVVACDDILSRSQSDALISDTYITSLKEALNNLNGEECKKIISDIIALMVEGPYSAAHCNSKILEIVSVISRYLHEHNIHTKNEEIRSFENIFYASEDINEIEEWMHKIIDECMEHMSSRKEDPVKCLVQIVKDYIGTNYKEDISLMGVAQKVHVSSSYLSKIFKEETGVNFNNYVTNVRMDKAAQMLLGSDMSVDEIAKEIGYNTGHYFIKKFKEIYGTTPKNYRMEHIR